MLAMIRYALRDLSKKIQRIEDLKVAFGRVTVRVAPPVLERKRIRVIGVVDDVVLGGVLGDLRSGHRTACDVVE